MKSLGRAAIATRECVSHVGNSITFVPLEVCD
jgi:hypothetical protein